LEGTLAAAVLCVARGAHILRVHDVEAVRRAVLTAEAVLAERVSPGRPGKREACRAG
jgi:dihydropteroate synthase